MLTGALRHSSSHRKAVARAAAATKWRYRLTIPMDLLRHERALVDVVRGKVTFWETWAEVETRSYGAIVEAIGDLIVPSDVRLSRPRERVAQKGRA